MAKKKPGGDAEGDVKQCSAASSKSLGLNPNWEQLKASLTSQKKRKKFNVKSSSEGSKTSAAGAASGCSEAQTTSKPARQTALLPTSDDCSLTDVIAMDCEMVGVGPDGSRSALARVTLVNASGNAVYDEYVRPLEFVSDFRSSISGIRARNLKNAKDLWTVQNEVSDSIKGRILVGHALKNDLKVLFLSHPKKDIRDTSLYKPLKSKRGRPRALRHLAAEILGATIQENEHCSAEDARAAMFIYQKFRKEWERSIKQRIKGKREKFKTAKISGC